MGNSTLDIMVCTDFSENAEAALAHAIELSGRLPARLHLCHIAENDGPFVLNDLGLREAEWRLRCQLALLSPRTDGLVHVRLGNPVEEILSLIRELKPALVVMCSRGRSLLRQALLGSMYGQLVRRSPVPVLLVPAPEGKLLTETQPRAEPRLSALG